MIKSNYAKNQFDRWNIRDYQMYLRISQEILAKILLLQLLHGSQKISPKMYQKLFMSVLGPSIHKRKVFECSNFGHICHLFFNSTYTRVDLYASIYGSGPQPVYRDTKVCREIF
jgi:hypothetical protein